MQVTRLPQCYGHSMCVCGCLPKKEMWCFLTFVESFVVVVWVHGGLERAQRGFREFLAGHFVLSLFDERLFAGH